MIRLSRMAKTFADGKEALRGVDLEIEASGLVGILGPNGAGKTTLLSLLVLALEPSSGSRTYDGLDGARAANHPAIRRMIGFLPQDFVPVRHLSGLEYLRLCAGMRGVPPRAADRRAQLLLDLVDLRHAQNRAAGSYSGGMRRRLGVAQALIHTPRLLVVDEPTAGLDPEERIRFRNLIAEVAEGTAVLLSTHICEDIEATCDRVVVVTGGSCNFDGDISVLLATYGRELRLVPAGIPLPPAALPLGRRIVRGIETQLVQSDEDIGEPYLTPSLEDAYAALLAQQHVDPAEARA